MMQTLELISSLSLTVICLGLAGISFVYICRMPRGYGFVPVATVEAEPIGMPSKGHKPPSAECRKAMAAMRALYRNIPAHAVASNLGYGTVSRMEKAIAKYGRRARAELAKEARV